MARRHGEITAVNPVMLAMLRVASTRAETCSMNSGTTSIDPTSVVVKKDARGPLLTHSQAEGSDRMS